MDYSLFLVHFFLAIVFFNIANFIGKNSISFGYNTLSFYKEDSSPFFDILYKAFIPVLLTFIVAFIFSKSSYAEFNKSIYLVCVYYFLIRWSFIVIVGRHFLTNWLRQFVIGAISIILILIIDKKFISQNNFPLPTEQELATTLWLGIISFTYKFINNLGFLASDNTSKNYQFIEKKYKEFSNKYENIISNLVNDNDEKSLVYSVLIYESINRHIFHRFIERIFFFTGKIKTTGIMQVASSNYLSDIESVRLGTLKLVDTYRIEKNNLTLENVDNQELIEQSAFRKAIFDYNPNSSYLEEVSSIQDTVIGLLDVKNTLS